MSRIVTVNAKRASSAPSCRQTARSMNDGNVWLAQDGTPAPHAGTARRRAAPSRPQRMVEVMSQAPFGDRRSLAGSPRRVHVERTAAGGTRDFERNGPSPPPSAEAADRVGRGPRGD